MWSIGLIKVPISWLGILHIYNIWNLVIRIAIYLVVREYYLHENEFMYNRSQNPGQNSLGHEVEIVNTAMC